MCLATTTFVPWISDISEEEVLLDISYNSIKDEFGELILTY